MERNVALVELNKLVGKDLLPLANKYGVTVYAANGKQNKGWAGHVIERYLGLPTNSSRAPNFGSWELKVVPLKRLKTTGEIRPKETMAITMIDPVEVAEKPFEDSHVYRKLRKAIVVGRMYQSRENLSSVVYSVSTLDLEDPDIYKIVKADYELVQYTIRKKGVNALTGKMGQLIQPRTKGAGGTAKKTRAFYARTQYVAYILGLRDKPTK